MVKKSSADDDKIFAFLGVFLTIIGFIIVILTKKDSRYAMYYAKQGLILGIIWILVWIVMAILSVMLAFIPIAGPMIAMLIWAVVGIGLLIIWLISWINALSGQMKPMPLFQGFADKINL
ncbi:MAG: hypothetical protein ABIJ18_05550 [archaeon]